MARTSAIAIPTSGSSGAHQASSPTSSSSSSSPSSSSYQLSSSSRTTATPDNDHDRFDPWLHHRKRQSLLSTSFCRAEHTTFDLGVRDGSPRVITYVKTSQGFDWNQDIFLPSSSDITIHNGINHPEAVHEIVLTDEDRFLPS